MPERASASMAAAVVSVVQARLRSRTDSPHETPSMLAVAPTGSFGKDGPAPLDGGAVEGTEGLGASLDSAVEVAAGLGKNDVGAAMGPGNVAAGAVCAAPSELGALVGEGTPEQPAKRTTRAMTTKDPRDFASVAFVKRGYWDESSRR